MWSQVTPVTAVTGGVAELPCHVEPDASRDVMRLMLWYKDSTGAPFYSYDTRGRKSTRGTHWANEDSLGQRSEFDPRPQAPLLRIKHVEEGDQGVYRCRADFRTSPTFNARVNLTVVVPPQQPRLFNETGGMISSTAGPYKEGDTARLICEVKGGRPPPNVTWWLEGSLVDSSWRHDAGVTRNTLEVTGLRRADLANLYTCMAGNTPLRPHKAAAARLDISFPPVDVRITNDKKASVSANKPLDLTCQVTGSRPQPVVTWSRNGAVLSGTLTRSHGNNVTSSTLRVLPSAEDSGEVIYCRAFSPAVPGTRLEDSITLKVNYRPVVRLTAGRTLQLSDIEEGDDVYFECHISAVPWVYSIEWRLDDRPLVHSQAAGVIMINQSLALQDLSRQRSGMYTCAATNDEGQGVSNALFLPVKYAPRCLPGQTLIYGAAKFEHVLVHCGVEANPAEVTFRWSFNNTGEITHLPTAQFTVNGTSSTAEYVPRSELDYGTLLCWARNGIGWQKTPCVFHIVSAGVPEPPTKCSSYNSSVGSLTVECLPGNDGGLPQRFVLEVQRSGGQLHYNATSGTPRFLLRDLQVNTFYQILIYAENAKGRSKPLVMETETLRDVAERRTEKVIDGSLKESFDDMLTVTPVLMILIVAIGGLLFIIIIIVILIRMRSRPAARRGNPPLTAGLPLKELDTAHAAPESDGKNPDLIQAHGEHGFPVIEATYGGDGPSGGERAGDISYIPSPSFVGGVGSSTLPRSGHCQQHHYNRDDSCPGCVVRVPLLREYPYDAPEDVIQYAELSLPHGTLTRPRRPSRGQGHEPVAYAQIGYSHHNHLPPIPPPNGWGHGSQPRGHRGQPAPGHAAAHESSDSLRVADSRPSDSSSTSAETVVQAPPGSAAL
ncbi:synaptogenesis protein syg-2-like [Pollicipes pollicipes]|uniref:synaptogenesis protein syg-2-like n=1 Tax=Pollicipes pollicipes TaxID=41117 RepID=UPI0018859FC7|nr:synaptogenesis protein syg-2-like [Pollicipes pollicipes]